VSPAVELTDRRGGLEGVLEEPNHTRVRKPGPLYTIYTIQFSLVGSKEFCLVFRRQYKKAMRLRKYIYAKGFSGNRLQSYAPRRYSSLFYYKFMHIKDNICRWPEPVFVNLLRSPGIDSQPGGPV
jgi:hypothetical protein